MKGFKLGSIMTVTVVVMSWLAPVHGDAATFTCLGKKVTKLGSNGSEMIKTTEPRRPEMAAAITLLDLEALLD